MAIKFLNTVAVDTNVLYVNAATNKVGIGTTSPSEPLHVAGRAIIEDRLAIGGDFTPQKALHLKNAAPVFRFEDSDITGGYLDMIKTSRNMRFDLEQNDATSATNFNFRIGGISQLYMRDQKAGIGVETPKAKLDVAGGVKIGNDTDAASADKEGTLRYHISDGYAKLDICMQASGYGDYAWFNVLRISMNI